MEKCKFCQRKFASVRTHILKGHCKANNDVTTPLPSTTSYKNIFTGEATPSSAGPQSSCKKRRLDYGDDADDDCAPIEEWFSSLSLMAGGDEEDPSTAADDLSGARIIQSADVLEGAKRMLQTATAVAFNEIGMNNVMEFDFLKLLIEFNLSQAAGDAVLQLIRKGVSNAILFQCTKKLPKTTSGFYQKMDLAMETNISDSTGIRMHTTRIKLPVADCFVVNKLTHIDITHMDLKYFFDSIPSRYTYEDLALPSEEHIAMKYTGKIAIDDFNT